VRRALIVALAAAGALLTACSSASTAGHPQAGGPSSAAAAVQADRATPPAAPVTSHPAVTRPTARPATSKPPAPKPKPKPPNPCAGNQHAQLIKVSIAAQQLWMCAGTTKVYQTPVTSGAVNLPYDSTPTGTFEIQGRVRNTTLTLNTGQTYAVQYWIPFQGPLFGFHDSSWQTFPYGSALYKTQGSHGCVHMPLAAIAYLYRWAEIGATVVIA
jgi:lipoprotein-anchoring transpeptidase ErfK/SrfK